MLVTLDTLTFTGADGGSVDMYINCLCVRQPELYTITHNNYVKYYVHIRGIYMHISCLLWSQDLL